MCYLDEFALGKRWILRRMGSTETKNAMRWQLRRHYVNEYAGIKRRFHLQKSAARWVQWFSAFLAWFIGESKIWEVTTKIIQIRFDLVWVISCNSVEITYRLRLTIRHHRLLLIGHWTRIWRFTVFTSEFICCRRAQTSQLLRICGANIQKLISIII